jgi:cobalt transporter subunit CbtB
MRVRKLMVAPSTADAVRLMAALAPAMLALLLGVVLVAGAGFASLPAAHNAAHDARHSFAFPCH